MTEKQVMLSQVLREIRDRAQVSTARASWKHLSADGFYSLTLCYLLLRNIYDLLVLLPKTKHLEPIIRWYYLFNSLDSLQLNTLM